MSIYQGQCHCGKVQCEFEKIKRAINCHCMMCRQMNGGSFSSYVIVEQKYLSLNFDQNQIKRYQPTHNATKHFCKTCATPIYNSSENRYPGIYIIYLGIIKNHQSIQFDQNVYCESKLNWLDTIFKRDNYEKSNKQTQIEYKND